MAALKDVPRRDITAIIENLGKSIDKTNSLNSGDISGTDFSNSGPNDPDNYSDLSDKISDNFATQSRWDEARRNKRQVKLRLNPDLIEEIDKVADAQGMTRNDWIENAIKKSLTP